MKFHRIPRLAASFRLIADTTAGIAGTLLFTIVASGSASAQTFYTSRTVFNSAVAPTQTLTFNNLVGTAQYPDSGPGTYKTTSTAGITIGGLSFVGYTSGYGYETFLEKASGSGGFAYTLNGTDTLVGGRGSTAITGFGSANAFGTEIGESMTNGEASGVSIQVVLANGGSYTNSLTYTKGVEQFFGFSNAGSAISAVYITANDPSGSLNPYPSVLDNFTTGNVTAQASAPEPESLTLAGLGVFAFLRKRRAVRRFPTAA